MTTDVTECINQDAIAEEAVRQTTDDVLKSDGSQNVMPIDSEIVFKTKKEKPRFTNICTFTRPVYTAYLRGIEPKIKIAITIFFMAICVMIIAFGVTIGVRLDIIGAGLLGCVISGLILGQPWLIARSKMMNVERQYGEFQRNITRFYDDHMSMENLTADVEATAMYSDIKKLKETNDFLYLYVDKYCYFAILTGFTRGEEEIASFKKFIQERAVNARGRLK